MLCQGTRDQTRQVNRLGRVVVGAADRPALATGHSGELLSSSALTVQTSLLLSPCRNQYTLSFPLFPSAFDVPLPSSHTPRIPSSTSTTDDAALPFDLFAVSTHASY